ncbi:MAG: glycosyltransferase [Lachnospiraceae bacterium]|nr:glycosyltransferase [Lachnospiraceae bacterium]
MIGQIALRFEKICSRLIPAGVWQRYFRFKIARNAGVSLETAEKRISAEYVRSGSGTRISWEDPESYTEKLNVSKLYGGTPLRAVLSDKLAVRDWVAQKAGDGYLIPLYGSFESFGDIDLSALPDSFVLKCNHDSGSVTLIRDKREIDRKERRRLRKKYAFHLKKRYAYIGFELHYDLIKPCILAEKYMGDNISDYKFFCFGGKPYYVAVHYDRAKGHKCNIYDMDWEPQPFVTNDANGKEQLPRPEAFSEMKTLAEKLCKGFDHVRVDLYEIDGKVYFGEMTFTPAGGRMRITPPEWDRKLGELWDFDAGRRQRIREKLKTTAQLVAVMRKRAQRKA